MMEDRKKMYKEAFKKRPKGDENVEIIKSIIKDELVNIRASYAVPTEWIKDVIFMELILNDSIFIVEFMIKISESDDIVGDLIVDNPFYSSTVIEDLALLENQLPYFYLNKLWTPVIKEYFKDKTLNSAKNGDDITLDIAKKEDEITPDLAKEEDEITPDLTKKEDEIKPYLTKQEDDTKLNHLLDEEKNDEETPDSARNKYETLDQVILELFSVDDMLKVNKKFNHFTDMFRCTYKESLVQTLELKDSKSLIVDMKNADKLSSVGIEFKVVERKYSLNVLFEKGCLKLPSFDADEAANIILRNVIAYEQCHDPKNAFTTNYMHFMNFLITTDKDVEILTSEGVLTSGVGRPSMVLEMVNELLIGAKLWNVTQYQGIVDQLNIHYRSHRKRLWAKLKKVYFSDLWTSTATLAAISVLLLTLAGTVASIIQAIKAFDEAPPPAN